jgi:hypothetical protein
LERRKSVERTTARRRQSACRRPGAGHLPLSASGRSRAVLLETEQGRGEVIALRRQPRVVYRVYTEEEYLAATNALTDWDAPPPTCDDDTRPADLNRGAVRKPVRSASGSGEPLLRRLAGAALLTGALGAVGAVVAAVFLTRVGHPVHSESGLQGPTVASTRGVERSHPRVRARPDGVWPGGLRPARSSLANTRSSRRDRPGGGRALGPRPASGPGGRRAGAPVRRLLADAGPTAGVPTERADVAEPAGSSTGPPPADGRGTRVASRSEFGFER